MARSRTVSLSRQQILSAAFDLLEQNGLDGVTMRALATQLGVQAPALYWHVRDKAELNSLMANAIYAEARQGLKDSHDAAQWLVTLGEGFWRALSLHKDAARLVALAHPINDQPADVANIIAAPLMHYGMGKDQALQAQAAILSLTLGLAIYRENSSMAHFLSGMFDLEESFRRGLHALVEGLLLPSGQDTGQDKGK